MNQSPRDPLESSSNAAQGAERQIIEKVLLASIEEQRRARRWGIFFKSLFAIYLGVGLFMAAKPFKMAKDTPPSLMWRGLLRQDNPRAQIILLMAFVRPSRIRKRKGFCFE